MSETIVMIHGMMCGSWVWENYVKFFEEKGYSCIAPNLRYHDVDPHMSPHPLLGNTSLLDYAKDLEGDIQKCKNSPILMGHSMGGLLAQMLAGRGLAKAVVLLAPASPGGIMALKPSVIRFFLRATARWGFWKKPVRVAFRETVYAVLNRVPGEARKEIYDKFVHESGRTIFEIGFWYIDPKEAAQVDESKVTCPVLVVVGANDRLTPVPIVRKVARKYEAVSTYEEFENHAHWIIGEPGWTQIAEHISHWLDEVVDKPWNKP